MTISGVLLRSIAVSIVLATVCASLNTVPLASADGASLIEIYEHIGDFTLAAPPPDMKPITLQAPEAFRYGSSKGVVRNWGLNLLTYYPSFTSPEAPENRPFGLSCAGDCNGRILISIENWSHEISNPRGLNSPNMGDNVRIAALTRKIAFATEAERAVCVLDEWS
jgi:hypothetical protein